MRLYNKQTGGELELWSIGAPEELSWQPLHSKEDLVWGRFQPPETKEEAKPTIPHVEPVTEKRQPKTIARKKLTGFYSFSPQKMFYLIGKINEEKSLTQQEAQKAIGVRSHDRYVRYERFLRSSNFIVVENDKIVAQDSLASLWNALKNTDVIGFRNMLENIPSFKTLLDFVWQQRFVALKAEDWPIPKKPFPAYISIGDAVCAWLKIPGEGVTATDMVPEPNEFSTLAIETFHSLSAQTKSDWILTGKWLEKIALDLHIHPIYTRKLLHEAKKQNLLVFFLEGSTPDTRFESHTMSVLVARNNEPILERVFLYHGDFIMPGTAGVRIKIKGVNNAA